MDNAERVPIKRVTPEGTKSTEDVLTAEFPLTIIVNDKELVTLLCSPTNFNYLTIGFLSSEGFITNNNDIKNLLIDELRGIARIEIIDTDKTGEETYKRFISSGCGRGATFYNAADIGYARIESRLMISPGEIFPLVKEFHNRSENYRTTGGVHSAALCDTKRIIVFHEDIGRHNAIDKVFGQCLIENISTSNSMIVTSGRITSEIVLKTMKRSVPIIISKSAPTNLAVKLANDIGVTLIGFVRGERMNIYSHDWRVTW